jgi:hypothetical protein
MELKELQKQIETKKDEISQIQLEIETINSLDFDKNHEIVWKLYQNSGIIKKMVSTERMIFGNGIGIVKAKGSLMDAKNILIQNSEHWNSGETESNWVQCFFEKPSIVTKIQIAFRSVEFIRIVGNRSNVEKETFSKN